MGSRRTFIKKSAAGLAGLSLTLTAKSYGRILGANDRVHVAFIGCGRRVGAYYDALKAGNNVHLSYICDVKKSQLDKVSSDLSDHIDYMPKREEDMRRILEDPEVDAIINATPDHWHAPGAWMAMEAGKHVYVEKPCSHNPREGELLVQFQKKYNRIVQMGNQQRSDLASIEIIQEIHKGAIGRPYKALAFYNNARGEVVVPREASPPADLNWDLFQGPAPREDYRHNTWDYNWHWYGWKWGTAETGNNATHELDIARWALQVDFPNQVKVDAAKEHYKKDGWEMYDTMYASFLFDNETSIHWDGKSRNNYNTYGSGRGTIIYGTEGSVYMDRGGYRLFGRDGKLVREHSGDGDEAGTALGGGGGMSTRHFLNFTNTIRGNDNLKSPIDEGAKSTLLCHLANISYRAGSDLEIDSSNGHIKTKAGMNFWDRKYEPGWEPVI